MEVEYRKGKKDGKSEKARWKAFLRGKFTGRFQEIKSPSEKYQDHHHRRLSCSACHAHYMLQCMGCHVRFDPRDRHFDKIWARERKGLWEEHESYREIEKPYPGINILLSQVGTFDGKSVVKFNRVKMRTFTREELERILRVGLCLNCHHENDRIFNNWRQNIQCKKLKFSNIQCKKLKFSK